jgi:RHS repeat-associated protein
VSGDAVSYWPTATAGSAGAEGANALNQPRSRGTLKTRVSGTSHKDAAVTVGGIAAVRASPSDRYWDAALPNYGQNATVTVSATLAGQTTQTATVQAVTRPGHETLAYDEDGNLVSDAQWSYEWDAENRLRRMKRNATGASWGAPDRELEFTYDYVGRRIRKLVKENGAVASDRKFLYDGWNLIAELDTATGRIVRSHVWGLDVASSLSATGGVGALVLQTMHSDTALTSYHVAYDGGGNVTALVTRAPRGAGDGKVAVAYEYGPFGETVRAAVDPGLSAALRQELATQPFRFSTRFTDGETGLVYYGLRYYDPGLGRFLNRDPLGEAGGENFYAFVGNGPVNRLDVLGANPFAAFWAWLTGSGKPTTADGGDGGSGGALTVYVGSDDDSGFNGLGDAIESGAVFQHGGFADAAARQQETGSRRRYADWDGPNSVFVWEGQEFPLRHPVGILKPGQKLNRNDSVITDGHIFTILSPTDLSDELSDGRFVYVLNRDTGNVYGINPRASPPNHPDREQLDLQLGRALFVASLMGTPNPAVLAARSGGTAAAVARVGAAEMLPATLNPNRISFMQSSIKNQTGEFTVLGNAEALKVGTLKATDLSSIRVWADDSGKIWTLDHRRLGSFRLAEVREVPVQWASPRTVQEEMWKMTTKTGGSSIRLKLGNGQNVIIK